MEKTKTKRAQKTEQLVAEALVAAFVAASTRRHSELEEMVSRLCYEYDYARRDFVKALETVRDCAARDLERYAEGYSTFYDHARHGADVATAKVKLDTLRQGLESTLRAVEKAEPMGDVAVVLSVFRFFRGADR